MRYHVKFGIVLRQTVYA